VTTLNLVDAFIAPTSDLSATVALEQDAQAYIEGSRSAVRSYAGGRRRIVSTPGPTEVVQVLFDQLARSTYFELLDLVGVSVLFRDQFGRRVFGLFASITGQELSYDDDLVGGVSFSIEEIDVSEVV